MTRRGIVFLALALLAGGCAGHRAFVTGEELLAQGMYDQAVARYAEAVAKDPQNHEFRMRYQGAKTRAALVHLKEGERLLGQGELQAATAEFAQAAALDSSVEAARQGLKKAQDLLRSREMVQEAEGFFRARRFAQAKKTLEEALILDPANKPAAELLEKVRSQRRTLIDGFELEVTSDKPITLKFKEADVRDVFNILSKLSGINFIFDEDVKAKKVTVLLEDATFAQALELLLNLNSLDKKVLNARTILIYPKTKEKEKQYEDQIIQTFYLSNIDAKKAVNLLRTMLQLRKIYVHEELNALVIRDTPEVIKLSQQIIEAADRADAEVVFELELLEVNHTDTLRLGTTLKPYSVDFGLAEPGADNFVARTNSFSNLEFLYSIPNATFDFQKTLSDSEVLASPKIRVKNKEKAKVHVGSREPVITVTFTGNAGQFTENIQYVDVGVKLDIEPTVQLDDTIVTKLNLEVSNISGEVPTTSGSRALIISTTNAQTALTLKDGGRTILGGLIRDDARKAKTAIPLLGDLPIIGDLISSHQRDKTKREVLLSITPHIVKSVDIPRADVASIWSGLEEDLKAGPSFGAFAVEPETERRPAPTAPALQAPPPLPGVPVPGAEALPMTAPPVPAEQIQPPLAPPVGEAVPPAFPPAPAGVPTPGEVALPAAVPPATLAPAPAVTPPLAVPVPVPVPAAAPAEAPPVAEERVEQVLLPPLEIPPAEGGQVFLSAPTQVGVGQELTVAVGVKGVQNLYSAPLFFSYDPAALEFVRAERGEFLEQGGQTTVFTTSVNREKGELIVGYKQGTGAGGASGAGTLFRLVFKGRAPGQGALGLDRINFRDPAGNRLPVEAAGLTVEVR